MRTGVLVQTVVGVLLTPLAPLVLLALCMLLATVSALVARAPATRRHSLAVMKLLMEGLVALRGTK